MDANHIDASICFPNTLPRFCGQTFLERDDKELALLCVQAYNDWMIDEWCAGDGKGRLIPLTMVPLWDAELAAAEVRRCADQGQLRGHVPREPVPARPAVDPRQGPATGTRSSQACEETETVDLHAHRLVARRCPATSPDAPFIVSSTLTFSNAMGSMCDYIFSGTLERFPTLKIAYSEGQVGWMPYVLERADKLVGGARRQQLRHVAAAAAVELRARPGLRLHLRRRDRPAPTATSSAWTRSASRPTTRTPTRRSRTRKKVVEDICAQAGLNDEETLQAPPRQRHHARSAWSASASRSKCRMNCSSTTTTASARSRSTGPRSRTR